MLFDGALPPHMPSMYSYVGCNTRTRLLTTIILTMLSDIGDVG